MGCTSIRSVTGGAILMEEDDQGITTIVMDI